MPPEMLIQSLQQLPWANHSIPIMSPPAAAAADMTVLERQIARLHWQQQQPQPQQQPSYFADTIPPDTSLIPTPYSPPQPPHILPPTTVSLNTTDFCSEQEMISRDLPGGSAGVWPDLTHYRFLCDSGPGAGGGGAISRTFGCPPLVGNVESRGPQTSQLEHASTTKDAAAAVAALSTDGAREILKKRKSAETANTYKVEEDDRVKKMIKVENADTLVEPKVESPSSTVITTNKCKDNNNNNREASSSASKEEKKKKKKKAPEPPPMTDYIHVRARRGQATDSHSLAERVRREKISERMKLLQDLVPGCNKITGKAGMLDEIINYVQSLQRQVEFLSMKLATVPPALDFNLDALIAKEMSTLAGGCGIPGQMGLPPELFGLSFHQFNGLLQQQAMAADCCSLPVPMVSSCSPAEEALRCIAAAAATVSAPPESCSFPDSCNILVHPPPPTTTSGWEGELRRFYTTTLD